MAADTFSWRAASISSRRRSSHEPDNGHRRGRNGQPLGSELLFQQQVFQILDRIARRSLHGTHLGTHQLEIGTIDHLAIRNRLLTVLHIGQAFAGQRVRTEIGSRVVLIQSDCLLQA
jgi:hypothetical protein